MTVLGNRLCQESGWPRAVGKYGRGGVRAPSTDWTSDAGNVTSLGVLVKHSKQRGKCLNGSLCFWTTWTHHIQRYYAASAALTPSIKIALLDTYDYFLIIIFIQVRQNFRGCFTSFFFFFLTKPLPKPVLSKAKISFPPRKALGTILCIQFW